MKLCVLANLYAKKPLEEVLADFQKRGVEAVEIGCGGYPGKDHADPEVLLNDEKAFEEWIGLFGKYGIELAALSAHGNPVHPDKATAEMYDKDLRNAILLAEKAGVDTVITFSGCP
ncbi:MAG: sugar phosphate isomerase/epimerase, partial [Clostridia bacterium]|nr:sugar phosphate isomerase/epimerase [Clostridia bacterium]